MSKGKEKKIFNILSGFLRSRCMYRTIPKFLMHHLFFKKFSSGVLPKHPSRAMKGTFDDTAPHRTCIVYEYLWCGTSTVLYQARYWTGLVWYL